MRSGKDTIDNYAVKRYGVTKYAFGDALQKYVHSLILSGQKCR
jgi:hypothetical protein